MIAVMSEKKKHPGRPRKADEDMITVQARVGGKLHAALEKAAGLSRRSKNTEMIVALEKHLESLGLWPPTEAASESDE